MALIRFLVALSVAMLAPTVFSAPDRGFEVRHYDVRLEPDLASKSVTGTERIDIVATAPGLKRIEFDAGELEVEEARIGRQRAEVQREGARLVLLVAEVLPVGQLRSVQLRYRGRPRFGLEFHETPAQVYTIFSTSQWMVCLDDPAVRATLDLSVVLPAGFIATASGKPSGPRDQSDGRSQFRWRQDVPVPSFTYGFAAGRWNEASEEREGIALRYLSGRMEAPALRQAFADTSHMIQFMTGKAGRPMAVPRYEQALVASTIGQEAAGFALLSEDYGRRVLGDPALAGLIAHEVAHQWWGVMVTCEDWGHFWLNEGFATFMSAAWMEARFGPAAYARILDGWVGRVERLQAEGKDHALVYEAWARPTLDDRAVVYTRGAYTLHLLRVELGEEAFWKAIAAYTQAHWGRSANTAQFQAAVEASSGRDLGAFFAKWVYSHP